MNALTIIQDGKMVKLNSSALEKIAEIYRAINHGCRQRMLNLLAKEGSMIVTDIYVKLRLEQSAASQHLAILRRAGVVQTERRGKNIYYSLKQEAMQI